MGRDWAWTRYRAGARSQVRSRRFQSPCREWRQDPSPESKLSQPSCDWCSAPTPELNVLAIRAAGTGVGPETTARLSAPHFPSDPSDSPAPKRSSQGAGTSGLQPGCAPHSRPRPQQLHSSPSTVCSHYPQQLYLCICFLGPPPFPHPAEQLEQTGRLPQRLLEQLRQGGNPCSPPYLLSHRVSPTVRPRPSPGP